MVKMHLFWKYNSLGKEPAEGGVSLVQFDESKIVANQNITFWMFGIIDRRYKACHIFCVKDNRTKESLLPLLKENVITNDDIIINNYNSNIQIHKYCFSTRVYSDCFATQQKQDFKELGFFLHRVNPSIWFGRGNFHTNNIEGLWSIIKRISNDFAGININYLEKLENDDIDVTAYIDGWICPALFLDNAQ